MSLKSRWLLAGLLFMCGCPDSDHGTGDLGEEDTLDLVETEDVTPEDGTIEDAAVEDAAVEDVTSDDFTGEEDAPPPCDLGVIGDDIRITDAPGIGAYPSLTYSGSEYGLAWTDNRTGRPGLYFCRLSPAGEKIGSDVNIPSPDFTGFTRKSLLFTGSDYGLAWTTGFSDLLEGDVYLTRLSLEGVKIGTETLISEMGGTSFTPSMAFTSSEYGIAFINVQSAVYTLYFARVSASGEKIGDSVLVRRASEFTEKPSIAFSGSEFALTWSDFSGAGYSIFFARLTPSGDVIGTPSNISSESINAYHPVVAFGGTSYGVAWTDTHAAGVFNIYFELLSLSGETLVSDVRVSDDTTNNPDHPSIVFTGSEYGIAWEDLAPGENNLGVYFARISSSGVDIGTDILVAQYPMLSLSPSVAFSGSEFAVSWEEEISTTDRDIYLERLACIGE